MRSAPVHGAEGVDVPSAPRDLTCDDTIPDDVETLIADVWRQVLNVEHVACDADFFCLGGDSLLATRVLSRLKSVCHANLSLRAFFDAPTVSGLARAVRAPREATVTAPERGAKPYRSGASLSFSQERMWFMHGLASASAAYHVSLAIRLRGALDTHALQAALDSVVQRHEILRTTFIGYSSGVSARIAAERAPQLSQIVLHRPDASADLERVRTYLSEFTNGTFELDKGPLLRGALVHIAADDAVLLFVAHHIVADQWALDVLLRELAGFYTQHIGGRAYAPPPLAKTYSAYAQWHRSQFESQRRTIEIAYWKRKLAGLEPVVLNADYPRPLQQSFRGTKLRLDFAPGEIAALTAFAAARQSTLALLLMTALKVLLHRHTQQPDIAIGVPIANRHHAESEPLIGTLVNTLVLRTDLGGDPSFSEALGRVRDTALEAFEHQDTPFEAIVKELQIPRDASRSPLFSVLFNMLNTPLGDVRLPNLNWSRFDFDKKASQFDLTVTIDAAHDRSISFEYSQDLFAPATIARLADHYARLLRSVLELPSLPLSRLPIVSREERELLTRWSHGRSQRDGDATLVELLRQTCARTPNAVALTIDDQKFSYRELDSASDRIAAALRSRGVGRGSRVGLCLHRSAQLVIAQWATLKCGAAYVPLDPSYPRDRLAFMTRDARLAMLITEPALATDLDWSEALCPVMEIDIELARDQAVESPSDSPHPEDAAYVIYTSGSTGQPKGVVVSHRAVANFLHSMALEPGLKADDRVLAITTLSFDIAVLELFLPWIVGAHVVMATQDQVTDADALRRLITTHEISVLQATPSTWRMLMDAGWEGSTRLRALVGGEPLPRELAANLVSRCREVWNMYGPTETTVWSTCWKVDSPLQTGISLGRPIANTQVFILDAARRICPIGVPGEICIGGLGLADGYFDRPELSRERFIADPFAPQSQQRLYCTGDRGRWRHDGALEHLGRLDSQVKVRGHRIELGEIESQLVRHPDIHRALATTRESRAGDVRLIAYVVPKHAMPDAAALRTFLRERLPDYMLPQWFVPLDTIPTLPNGKTDLRRLPAPHQDAQPAATSEPRTKVERELCGIWRDVLQVERVGIHDNFFDLGGHSILTVRLVSRVRVDLRLACTLPMVFRYPTVATLAAALEGASTLDGNSLIPLQPLGADPPLFCICGVQIYQELAHRLAPAVPVYGVFVPMEMEYVVPTQDGPKPLPAVERLAAEYLQTIRNRQPRGPYRLLGFSFGGVLAFEMAQQLKAAGEEVSFLAILDSDVPDRRKRQRAGRLDQRLKALKGQLGRRLKSQIDRLSGNAIASQHIAEARDEKYVTAMRTYSAAPYRGPAVYVQAIDAVEYDPGYGWGALISRLRTYRIPGDHLGILSPPNVDLLAQKLLLHLRK